MRPSPRVQLQRRAPPVNVEGKKKYMRHVYVIDESYGVQNTYPVVYPALKICTIREAPVNEKENILCGGCTPLQTCPGHSETPGQIKEVMPVILRFKNASKRYRSKAERLT